jgi:hypothetical protein
LDDRISPFAETKEIVGGFAQFEFKSKPQAIDGADSTYATKGGTPARLGYYDNYLVDNASCVIVGVQGTAARMSQETVAAQEMITRFAQWLG